MARFIFFILIIAALSCGYLFYRHVTVPPATPVPIPDAIAGHKVEVKIVYNATASPDSNSPDAASPDTATPGGTSPSATITLSPVDAHWWQAPAKITIPAGTVLLSDNNGAQRLMTARPVTVVVSASAPSVSQVETYCIDQFALTPAGGASLSFDIPTLATPSAAASAAAPAGSGGTSTTTVETEPLHKLADCLSQSSLSHGDRQIAVWMFNEGLLLKSPEDALQYIVERYVPLERDEARKQVVDLIEAREKVLDRNFTEEEFRSLVNNEMADEDSLIVSKAREKASAQIASFLAHDRDVLISCGSAEKDMPIFNRPAPRHARHRRTRRRHHPHNA